MNARDLQQLGDVLRAARETLGLSQRKAAARSGVSFAQISRLEAGSQDAPTPETLQRLAAAYEADVEDFYVSAGTFTAGNLPGLKTFLRTKLDLPEPAVAELAKQADVLRAKYQQSSLEGTQADGAQPPN